MLKPLKIKKSYGVAFSPDSCRLATLGRYVWVWDISARKKIWKAHPFKNPFRVVFSPDGSSVAVKSTAGNIAVLDADSGEIRWETDGGSHQQGSNICFTPCGKYLLNGTWAGSLSRHRAVDGSLAGEASLTGKSVGRIALCFNDSASFAVSFTVPGSPHERDPVFGLTLWSDGFADEPSSIYLVDCDGESSGSWPDEWLMLAPERFLFSHGTKVSWFDLKKRELLLDIKNGNRSRFWTV